ncbi:negative regulator of differentiation 1 [Fusarium heterosporum]|uniref:Negative regulator of differentiation 1 n=1 Tax=Fusarium heterosporum TaxID=42747 RepID=A0A8H5TFQ0_FUSHE|nr:negative regulator of differentiation 1 [Fusarium heterosporum]
MNMMHRRNQTGPKQLISKAQCVYIRPEEYDGLVTIAHQYACLRHNLIERGVDDATLNSLCLPSPNQDMSLCTHGQPSPLTSMLDVRASPCQKLPGSSPEIANEKKGGRVNVARHHNTSTQSSTLLMDHQPPSENQNNNKRIDSNQWLERSAQRSIQLLNLPPDVSYGDVSAVVRGGPLLEIFLRCRENSATVSFVREADAVTFLEHTRAHGLYIKDRKIHTKWSDHQYVVKGQVVYHVTKGASRNFVIRKRDLNLTAQDIRDDLEHIHNLHVVNIELDKDNCFVSTNAIHAAIFARTCLQSRVEYKNCRIEWVADECSQPLGSLPSETPVPISGPALSAAPAPEVKLESRSASNLPSRKNLMGNRFRVLNLSDTDGSNGDDSSEEGL